MISQKKKVFSFILLIGLLVQLIGLEANAQTGTINYDKGIELAQKLALDGKYDVSRAVCQRILRDVPNYTDAYLIMANTYSWENDFDSARMYYYKVFEFENGNILAFDQLIQIELWEGNGLGAVELSNSALQYHPENTELLLKKARGHIMLNEIINAKKSLFILLSVDPDNQEASELYRTIATGVNKEEIIANRPVNSMVPVDTLFKQAQNYSWNEDFVPARRIINAIIDTRPDYTPAYTLLAQTYAWQDDYATARRIVQAMDLKATVNRQALLTAVDIEMWSEKFDEALRLLDTYGLNYLPMDDELLFKKAEVYREKGDFLGAKKIVYQQLTKNPNNAQALQFYNELKGETARVTKNYRSDLQNEAIEEGMDVDAWISQAREFAQDGRFLEAQSLCQKVLDVFPGDYEALYLMGTIMAWQKAYPEARLIYEALIAKYFDSYELIGSLVDLGIWEKNYADALDRVNNGLEIYQNDKEFLVKKANILRLNGQPDESQAIVNQLLAQYPGDKAIKDFFAGSSKLIKVTGVSAEYTYNSYKIPNPRTWQMFGGKYYKSNDYGTFLGGLNYGVVTSDTAPLPTRSGIQFEIGAYPVFEEQERYLYINYGFSPSAVFARHRFGAHIYQMLKRLPNWEFAGGFSYSYFRNDFDTTHVIMFDVGLNKYFETRMIGFSVNIAPTSAKISQGYTIMARQYFGGVPDNWVQIGLSAGVYPDNPALYQNDINSTPYLNSYNLFVSARHILSEKIIGTGLLGFQRQEYQANVALRNNLIANFAIIYLLEPPEK